MMDIERMKKEIDEWYNSKAYDKWCERLLFIDKLRERNNKVLLPPTVKSRGLP